MVRKIAQWHLPVQNVALILVGVHASQLYHPGYPAFHVTRLHRYEHVGVESMLEAEAQWHFSSEGAHHLLDEQQNGAVRFGRATSRRLSPDQPETVMRRELRKDSAASSSQRPFLQVSSVQEAGLRKHHVVARDKSTSSQRSTQLQEIQKAEKQAMQRMGVSLHPSGHMLQDARKQLTQKSTIHGGTAVTGLSNLFSQYVGPIGVGTVVAPSACRIHHDEALEFLEREAEEEKKKACHLEDESQVWVVFDTGSTNIWVSSDLCREGPCVKKGRRRYNHTRSATSTWPRGGLELTVQFGTGCIKGPQAVDDFHIGPFTVFNQTFGMIENQNGTVFDEVPFEGILGLAFYSMSANGVSPFFDTIIEQRALAHNEFAFYFSLDSVTANAVFWGGVDPAFYQGQIEYFPIVDPYYWAIDLLSFKIGDKEFIDQTSSLTKGYTPSSDVLLLDEEGDTANRPYRAIVDTGTTFFTAEGDMFDEIMDLLPSSKCNAVTNKSHPPVTYRLKNVMGKSRDFVLHNSQYMTSSGTGQNNICSPAFMRIDIPQKHGPAMVLGECFLRHYFAVFDRGMGNPHAARVGFAKSVHGDDTVHQLRRLTRGQQYFKRSDADSSL